MSSPKKPRAWLPLLVLVVAAAKAGGAAPERPAIMNDMEVTQWREDLAILREQMPKTHGNLFHTITRQQFEGELDTLEGSLPRLTANQVKVGIMRLVALVNDGHTRVRQESFENHTLPVKLHFFSDGLYVVSADEAYANIVGGKVKKIGLMSAQYAYAAVRPLISVDAENEGRRRFLATDFLVTPEVLQVVGATKSLETVDITVDKDGQEAVASLSPGPWSNNAGWPMEPKDWADARKHAKNPLPLWEQHPDKHYWHVFLDHGKTLYVQYNQVEDEPGGEPIAAYFPRIFREAEQRKVERVIIDVRLNGGGNNGLNRPIWHALLKTDRLNQKGRLWVVTGPKTFSAAMNFVDNMESDTNAMFAGEPTGETPNMWGDPASLKLPNSGIVIQASTLWWQMADPSDRRPFRAPDIPLEMTFADYANNVDPVVKAILETPPRPRQP